MPGEVFLMAELDHNELYVASGEFYYYIEDVPHNPDFAICRESSDDYGYLTVVRKSDLKLRTETWQWQQNEKYKAEMEAQLGKVQANLDELAEQVVDKALKSLSGRMKLNIVFGKGGSGSAWALPITDELEKMIRESGKKIAGKEKFEL